MNVLKSLYLKTAQKYKLVLNWTLVKKIYN